MNQYETERERLSRQYAEFSDTALAELAADLALSANEPIQQRQISGPLVMVKRFRDMPEAQVAESILDSAGIDCFLADENTIRMDWLWSNLLGGFKLMVRPEDLDAATQLLDQANVSESTEQGDTTKEAGDERE